VKEAKELFISHSNNFMAENQNDCQKLARGFIVLVDEAKYNVKTEKYTHEMSCIT
jgi:hypothetical protein